MKLRTIGSLALAGTTLLALASTSAPSAATTSSSAPRAPHRARSRVVTTGHAYAAALSATMPLPGGATRLATPLASLHPVTGGFEFAHLADIPHYYVLNSPINVTAWAESRFPPRDLQGSGSTYDGGLHTSVTFSVLERCHDRRAAYCAVTYSAETLSAGRQELRVDTAVVWTAVHVAHLPRTGVVTLTGYDHLSLMKSPSDPVTVTLSRTQTDLLREAIASLRGSPGGLCMEDTTLYTITVRSSTDAKVFWSAVADQCPGELVVSRPGSRLVLNGRSCRLESLVSSFLPPGRARATKEGLKGCEPL
ncbi:MAG TPA: hypothetical protein VMV53_03540 [Acidimicrobiales bacterium]|nr:hypothetical protein [Acidimicrobiales bacterium]